MNRVELRESVLRTANGRESTFWPSLLYAMTILGRDSYDPVGDPSVRPKSPLHCLNEVVHVVSVQLAKLGRGEDVDWDRVTDVVLDRLTDTFSPQRVLWLVEESKKVMDGPA